MAALVTILLLAMAAQLPMGHCNTESAEKLEEWFETLPHTKEKVTKFHFFVDDTFAGNNATAVMVASANATDKPPAFFGRVFVMDDPLREGMKSTSKELGRAQGLYALSGLNEVSVMMAFNLVFTTGEYNGSTLAVFGRSPSQSQREMPIIGGSGVFRLARGVAATKLRYLNNTSKAINEYNVEVIHY